MSETSQWHLLLLYQSSAQEAKPEDYLSVYVSSYVYIERDIYLNMCTHILVYYEEVIYAMWGLAKQAWSL